MADKNIFHEKASGRMKKLNLIFILVILAVGWQATALAAERKLLLRKIAPVSDVQLRGTKDAYAFSLPIPRRWQVKQAVFHFSYVNSSALLPLNSRLVFRIHGRPLAQIRLNPNAPEGEVSVTIPGDLLKEGYNPCLISVAQHYTVEECEDPFSPELWTWVNLAKAYFEFDLDAVRVPERVSAISDFIFDARNIFDSRVNIVIPSLTEDHARLAMLAGAGVALRYEYRQPEFSLSDKIRPQSDNIVIGDRQQIESLLSTEPTFPPGASIAVGPMRHADVTTALPAGEVVDHTHALITLSGGSPEELERAVSAFAALSYSFPDTAATAIANLQLPPVSRHMIQRGLTPGESYELASLGMPTTVFRGMASPATGVDLRLPSDLHLSPNRFVSIVLHMAYDAAMRSDSVLNIRLNGKFISGIPLENPQGDYFKGYQVDIPFSSFAPGMNRLSFEAVLTPLHTDKCTLIQTENLRLIIYGNSKIIIPEVPHWIKMPKIEVFFQDAFPFGRWPDLRETTMVLTGKTMTSAAAAVNLIALSAQKIGYPPFGLKTAFSLEQAPADTDILIIGPLATIPQSISAVAPLAGIDPATVTFPGLERPKENSARPMDFKSLPFGGPAATPRNQSDRTQFSPVRGSLTGTLGSGRAALMQLQHPQKAARTVMVLAATTAADLEDGSRALWESAVQANCSGDLALVDFGAPEHSAKSLQVGPDFYLGSPGPAPGFQNLINNHPLIALAVLLALLLLLCLVILLLLRRRRRKRVGTTDA